MDITASLMLYMLTRNTSSPFSPLGGTTPATSSTTGNGASPAAAALGHTDALNSPAGITLMLNDDAASTRLLSESITGINSAYHVFSERNLLTGHSPFPGGEFNALTLTYGADFTTQDVIANTVNHLIDLNA